MSINLKALISKLNDSTRKALEAAAGLCVARTHYDIEIEHYLLKLLDSSDNDLAAILKHFGIDRSRLAVSGLIPGASPLQNNVTISGRWLVSINLYAANHELFVWPRHSAALRISG